MPSLRDNIKAIIAENNASTGDVVTNIRDIIRSNNEVKPFSGFIPFSSESAPSGTTLSLSSRQRSSQRGAETETRRLESQFYSAGHGGEWEEYVEQEGRTGFMGGLDYVMDDILSPVGDVLQIGQYSTVGLAQELLRTGSASAAFKQSAAELYNALPALEDPKARKPSWTDVMLEHGTSPWTASVVGLLADVVIDPINLVPVAGPLVAITKIGKRTLPFVPDLAKQGFDFLFTTDRQLKKSGKELGFDAQAVIDLAKESGIAIENQIVKMIDDVDKLTAWMHPHERKLFGTWADQPMILEAELKAFARSEVIAPERVPIIMKAVNEVGNYTKKIFDAEVETGLVDKLMERRFYVHGTEVLNPKERRGWEKMISGRSPDDGRVRSIADEIFPSGRKPTSARPRKTRTQADRIKGMLSGDFLHSTETDIRNILVHRSAEHIRWMNYKKFLDNVVSDGRIAARVVSEKPEFFQSSAWKSQKRELTEEGTYGLLELTKRVPSNVSKGFDEVTYGAYVLPKPIVDSMDKMRAATSDLDDMGKFAQVVEQFRSIWSGWATLSTGYHARNYTSILFMNWIAGVGANYSGLKKGKLPIPGDFALRHLQAFKLQTMAEGAGRLPPKAKKVADSLARNLGFDNLSSVTMPKMVDDTGRVLGLDEVIKIGESYGVPQSATRLHNFSEDATKQVWGDLEKTVPVDVLDDIEGVSDISKLALKLGRDESSTMGETLNRIFGTENPLLKANKAFAQIVENNGRWALFLDQFSKGLPADVAAKATKTWHFDYRNLTQFEKYGFRNLMPFYAWQRFSVPRMVMAMLENPAKFARLPKAKQAMENLNASWTDQPQPDYFDEVQAVQLPYVHEDRAIYAQVDIPVLELSRLNSKDIKSSLHPIVKMLIEDIPPGGHNIFLDMPIERFPGEASEEFPFMTKRAQQHIGTIFPPFNRFAVRGLRAAKRDELAELLIGETTGVKLRALDTRRAIRGNIYKKRQLARDFKSKLKQEGVLP